MQLPKRQKNLNKRPISLATLTITRLTIDMRSKRFTDRNIVFGHDSPLGSYASYCKTFNMFPAKAISSVFFLIRDRESVVKNYTEIFCRCRLSIEKKTVSLPIASDITETYLQLQIHQLAICFDLPGIDLRRLIHFFHRWLSVQKEEKKDRLISTFVHN